MPLPAGAVALNRSLSENRSLSAAVNVQLRLLRISTMSVGLPELAEAGLPDDEELALPAGLDGTCAEGW